MEGPWLVFTDEALLIKRLSCGGSGGWIVFRRQTGGGLGGGGFN